MVCLVRGGLGGGSVWSGGVPGPGGWCAWSGGVVCLVQGGVSGRGGGVSGPGGGGVPGPGGRLPQCLVGYHHHPPP